MSLVKSYIIQTSVENKSYKFGCRPFLSTFEPIITYPIKLRNICLKIASMRVNKESK